MCESLPIRLDRDSTMPVNVTRVKKILDQLALVCLVPSNDFEADALPPIQNLETRIHMFLGEPKSVQIHAVNT
jgi:hypothetical protein